MTPFDRPLKVAMFSDSAIPILNGVSMSIDVLVRELRARGHSVRLYTSKRRGHKDTDPNIVRFNSLCTPWAPAYPFALPPFYPWFNDAKRCSFDLVHTHTPFVVGFVGLRWAQSLELPIVSTYHTHYDKYAHYVPFFPRRYVRYKIAKHTNFYYSQVDEVVTPSEASARWLRRHSVHRPVSVVPTGIRTPVRVRREDAREALGVAPDDKVLVYVGRLASEKNLATLMEAFRRVWEQDRSSRLWLVGDGPARSELVQMARGLGIGDRVTFWGFVDHAQIDPYYAAADMFVFASMTETQGLVVSEAMSHGLPVVVVQGGGASDAVVDNVTGRVVPNDPREMASVCLSLFADPLASARLAASAEADALKRTVPVMVDGILRAYGRALGKSYGPVPTQL